MTTLEQAASSTIVSGELPVCAHGDTLSLPLQTADLCSEEFFGICQWNLNHQVCPHSHVENCCRSSAVYMSDLVKREGSLFEPMTAC